MGLEDAIEYSVLWVVFVLIKLFMLFLYYGVPLVLLYVIFWVFAGNSC